jgi:hypothetical protein
MFEQSLTGFHKEKKMADLEATRKLILQKRFLRYSWFRQ